MNFGTNLRNLRVQRGLTQQRLASDMGISQASITSYETGFREPNFEMVRKFAEYFHVAPSMLLPFCEVSDNEYAQRVTSILQENPKIRDIFDQIKNFSERDLDVVLTVVNSLASKNE